METAPKNIATPPTVVGFVSLGCPKNLIDSERMLASLALEGYVVTGDLNAADVAVVNTCAFIEEARRESGEVIDDLMTRRRRGRLQMVIVAGCYPQLDADALLETWPDVDAVVGLAGRDELGGLIRRLAKGRTDATLEHVPPFDDMTVDDHARLRLTPRHFAYLRITEGCNNRCSYCSIPVIRGPLRSKPLASIMSEAAELVDDETRELIVIGQDTSAYGADLKGRLALSGVLRRLHEVPGIRWLRLLYTHPTHFGDDLIRAYAELDRLLPYVDLPLQHVSQPILDSMGRRTTCGEIRDLIASLRAARPDMVIRTTFIVGYPGESDDDFDELLDFIREVRFERLGAFMYSPEEGTRANDLPGHIAARVKKERLGRLMELQQEIALEKHHDLVGCRVATVIDQGNERPDQPALGRLWSQAPDIDGVTRVASPVPLRAGQFLDVEITAAGPYDLEARALPQ